MSWTSTISEIIEPRLSSWPLPSVAACPVTGGFFVAVKLSNGPPTGSTKGTIVPFSPLMGGLHMEVRHGHRAISIFGIARQ